MSGTAPTRRELLAEAIAANERAIQDAMMEAARPRIFVRSYTGRAPEVVRGVDEQGNERDFILIAQPLTPTPAPASFTFSVEWEER